MLNDGYLYTFLQDAFEYSLRYPVQMQGLKNQIILTIIADDHPYLINGIETDLNKDPKIKIVSTATSYDALLEQVKEHKPQIVLLDLKMPGCEKYNFKDFISKLKAYSDCKIIIFTSETGWVRIHRCLEIGASAYIEKAISLGKLKDLIHKIYSSSELMVYTAEELPQITVSKRQGEILHYMVDGKENNEIAILLDIDIKTVQSYINEIKFKFKESLGIYSLKPRTLLLLASKLGFGSKLAQT